MLRRIIYTAIYFVNAAGIRLPVTNTVYVFYAKLNSLYGEVHMRGTWDYIFIVHKGFIQVYSIPKPHTKYTRKLIQ